MTAKITPKNGVEKEKESNLSFRAYRPLVVMEERWAQILLALRQNLIGRRPAVRPRHVVERRQLRRRRGRGGEAAVLTGIAPAKTAVLILDQCSHEREIPLPTHFTRLN